MKVVKYYCDCCGREVEGEDDLETRKFEKYICNGFYNELLETSYDICSSCKKKIEKAKLEEFNKIRKENNKEI